MLDLLLKGLAAVAALVIWVVIHALIEHYVSSGRRQAEIETSSGRPSLVARYGWGPRLFFLLAGLIGFPFFLVIAANGPPPGNPFFRDYVVPAFTWGLPASCLLLYVWMWGFKTEASDVSIKNSFFSRFEKEIRLDELEAVVFRWGSFQVQSRSGRRLWVYYNRSFNMNGAAEVLLWVCRHLSPEQYRKIEPKLREEGVLP